MPNNLKVVFKLTARVYLFNELKRIKKNSFYWYQHVIKTNGRELNLDIE